ncbi:MAG: glycosidase [Syntrophomonadaceae bacterium]|nr:glycosidase [Syntrophomonadaceae bacterium]
MNTDNTASSETLFNQTLEEIIPHLKRLGPIHTIIGIPFYNEKESLLEILQMIASNAEELTSFNTLLICCGDPAGAEIIEEIQALNLSIPHFALVMKPGANGRGASIRVLLEVAKHLEADLIIIAADLRQEQGQGFKVEWIKQMARPIQGEYDLTLVNFKRHQLEDLLGRLFTSPLMEAFYGYRISDPHSGMYAISHDLVEDLCQDSKFWPDITNGYGIDPWLITRALRWNKRICEVELGAKLAYISKEKLNFVFTQTAASLFECITRDSKSWLSREPLFRSLDVYSSVTYPDKAEESCFSFTDMLTSFKQNYSQYERLSNMFLPSELTESLHHALTAPAIDFSFDHRLWVEAVYQFLLGYRFNPGISHDDLFNSLTFIFDGRIAGFLSTLDKFETLPLEKEPERGLILRYASQSIKNEQRKSFLEARENFLTQWQHMTQETRPPITPAHFMEFIPGAPLLLPKQLKGAGGIDVYIEEIFNQVQTYYQEKFDRFVHEQLQLPLDASPEELVNGIADFMQNLENTLAELLPGDLSSEEGLQAVIDGLFGFLPVPRMFSVKNELLQEALLRFPPMNVMIPLGYKHPRELLQKVDVRDAWSLAGLLENHMYVEKSQQWLLDNLSPETMGEVTIKPLVLGDRTEYGSYHLLPTCNYNKLSTRIVVSPYSKGIGGKYPHLYFCLMVAHQVALAVNYSHLWRVYAREKRSLGQKVGNSLLGWYQARTFSVYNIFENSHQRLLVNNIKAMADTLKTMERGRESEMLQHLVESYGLSQILEDGTFLPCSAWTWATYSYKGGQQVPTPLSAEVEEKWFTHHLLEEIYTAMDYNPGEIEDQVIQLIGEGRASDDLLNVILGVIPEDVVAVPQEMLDFPPARGLTRYPDNPILKPIKEHAWESRYVLNAAAVRIKDLIYILYRAFGNDEVSRIGLAISDGYRILERLPEPIYGPANEKDKKGCEDPRVVIIGDELYMLYTAYNGVIAQIAAASISLDDFLHRRFDRWQRKGLAFQDIWDKDAIVFPEKINGRYVIYHRIEPSIWVSHLDKLEFPAPKGQHTVILGPRSGRMWDSLKIGAGTQPLKTKYGWLMIYHGVDRNRVYRLGVMLVDLNNPERVLYRSPNPVLSPETEYEIGIPGEHWVPNVVFTCGAVPAEDKEILDDNDEIIVYYGAADTYLCAASAKVGDLIPEEIRKYVESHQ